MQNIALLFIIILYFFSVFLAEAMEQKTNFDFITNSAIKTNHYLLQNIDNIDISDLNNLITKYLDDINIITIKPKKKAPNFYKFPYIKGNRHILEQKTEVSCTLIEKTFVQRNFYYNESFRIIAEIKQILKDNNYLNNLDKIAQLKKEFYHAVSQAQKVEEYLQQLNKNSKNILFIWFFNNLLIPGLFFENSTTHTQEVIVTTAEITSAIINNEIRQIQSNLWINYENNKIGKAVFTEEYIKDDYKIIPNYTNELYEQYKNGIKIFIKEPAVDACQDYSSAFLEAIVEFYIRKIPKPDYKGNKLLLYINANEIITTKYKTELYIPIN